VGATGGTRADAGQRSLDHGCAVTDRRFGRGFIQRFIRETGGIHPRVGGDDHHFGGGMMSVSDRAFRTPTDPWVSTWIVWPSVLSGLFKSFRRHDGVRDAGGAGGDSNE
jgi:hypothetical protein